MKFKVPQFLDVESKIVGPLSFKQLVYVGGASGITIGFFLLTGKFVISLVLGLPFIVLGLLLAFKTQNGRPFILFLFSLLKFYFFSKKKFAWKKDDTKKK